MSIVMYMVCDVLNYRGEILQLQFCLIMYVLSSLQVHSMLFKVVWSVADLEWRVLLDAVAGSSSSLSEMICPTELVTLEMPKL